MKNAFNAEMNLRCSHLITGLSSLKVELRKHEEDQGEEPWVLGSTQPTQPGKGSRIWGKSLAAIPIMESGISTC